MYNMLSEEGVQCGKAAPFMIPAMSMEKSNYRNSKMICITRTLQRRRDE